MPCLTELRRSAGYCTNMLQIPQAQGSGISPYELGDYCGFASGDCSRFTSYDNLQLDVSPKLFRECLASLSSHGGGTGTDYTSSKMSIHP